MPALKNTRHEAFAQHRAKGLTIDQAYAKAGFKPNRGNAGRLNAIESVRRRVAELTEKAADKAVVTKAWILLRLKENAETCLQPGDTFNPAAANRALELLGKEQRMFVDRRLHTMRRLDDLSEEEILELLGGEPEASELGEAEGARKAEGS